MHPYSSVIGDLHLTGALPGRDEDDPVRTPYAIDRGGGSVLQYIHGQDICGVDIGNIIRPDPVYHIQRIGAAQDRARAADDHLGHASGLAAAGDLYTGHLALEGLGGCQYGLFGQYVAVYMCDRTRNVYFLLCTIADDDDFVQLIGRRQ